MGSADGQVGVKKAGKGRNESIVSEELDVGHQEVTADEEIYQR
jgi:hypothetical protein